MRVIEMGGSEFLELMLMSKVFDACKQAYYEVLPPNDAVDLALEVLDKRILALKARDPEMAKIVAHLRSMLVTIKAFNQAFARGHAAAEERVTVLKKDAGAKNEKEAGKGEPFDQSIQNMIDIFRSIETETEDDPVN